jgi:hypothetical protein
MKILDQSKYMGVGKNCFEFIDSEEQFAFRFVEGSDRPVAICKIHKDEDGEIIYESYYLCTEEFIKMAKMMLVLLEE